MVLGSYRWCHSTSMNYGITSSTPLASWHGAEIDLQVQQAAVAVVLQGQWMSTGVREKLACRSTYTGIFPFWFYMKSNIEILSVCKRQPVALISVWSQFNSLKCVFSMNFLVRLAGALRYSRFTFFFLRRESRSLEASFKVAMYLKSRGLSPAWFPYPPNCNHFQTYFGNIPESAKGGTTSKQDIHDAYSDGFGENCSRPRLGNPSLYKRLPVPISSMVKVTSSAKLLQHHIALSTQHATNHSDAELGISHHSQLRNQPSVEAVDERS